VAAVNGWNTAMRRIAHRLHFRQAEQRGSGTCPPRHLGRSGRCSSYSLCSQGSEIRGKVSAEDIAAIRKAGFSEGQIVEIVAVVAENFFTNLINNVAGTEVDFPAI
jgi:hypothetical protein